MSVTLLNQKAFSLILQYEILEKLVTFIQSDGHFWSSGSGLTAKKFGHMVFIYSVLWFQSNGPVSSHLFELPESLFLGFSKEDLFYFL